MSGYGNACKFIAFVDVPKTDVYVDYVHRFDIPSLIMSGCENLMLNVGWCGFLCIRIRQVFVATLQYPMVRYSGAIFIVLMSCGGKLVMNNHFSMSFHTLKFEVSRTVPP